MGPGGLPNSPNSPNSPSAPQHSQVLRRVGKNQPITGPPFEPDRCMYPGEWVRTLHEALHPRWWSIWVETNRWGQRMAKGLGLPQTLATVFVAPAQTKALPLRAAIVPLNCIPKFTFYTVKVDSTGRAMDFDKHLVPGWYWTLRGMVEEGYLRPTPRICHLLGEHRMTIGTKFPT